MRTLVSSFPRICLVTLVVLLTFVPFLTHAQTSSSASSELSSTIRAELLSDPRTSSLSEAQIETMVGLLAEEAQKQGITSQDIQWRPQNTEQFVATQSAEQETTECAGGFLCIMSEAFGFIGYDTTIPFFLGMSSMGLIWILAEMIHRHRHPAIKVSIPPTTSSL